MPLIRLAIPDNKFVDGLTETIKACASSFIDNLARASYATMMTDLLVGLSYLKSGIQRQAEGHHALGYFIPADHPEEYKKQWQESVDHMIKVVENIDKGDAGTVNQEDIADIGHGHAKQFENNYGIIRDGIKSANNLLVIGTWTAIEAMLFDLWVKALNANPVKFAELSGNSKNSDVGKPKPKKTAHAKPKPEEPGKQILLGFLAEHGYDLSGHMGTVLVERFNFQMLWQVRDAYLQAFDATHGNIRNAILSDPITLVCAIRNCLIHNSGIVDEEFQFQCKRIQPLASAPTKNPIPLTEVETRKILNESLIQCVDLIKSVDSAIR